MIVTDSGSNKEYENPDAGTYAGRCVRLVDLGTQINDFDKANPKLQRQIMISWEISEKMKDGRPFLVKDTYTLNIGDKSNLGKILNAWRGRPFTAEEKAGFDLSTILGVPGLVSVSYTEGGWQKIKQVLQLPKGMTVEDQYNDNFLFNLEDIHDVEKLKQLYPLERRGVSIAAEFTEAGLTMPDYPKKEEAQEDDDEDEVAF